MNDYLSWQITVTNTSTQTMEMGDFGLPLPFNEYWNQANDVIYETRTIYHSFTGNNDSYITVERPSGVGPFVLMTPDQSTGAGFEYMDNWVSKEHSGSAWAANGGTPKWTNGLDVFYIHSNVIKSTNRGYLPNTSLTLAPGASQTYGFKFFNVASHTDVQSRLYSEGMIDVSVVPSMIVPTNMAAKIDLHTSQTINSLTPQFASKTTITSLGHGGHRPQDLPAELQPARSEQRHRQLRHRPDDDAAVLRHRADRHGPAAARHVHGRQSAVDERRHEGALRRLDDGQQGQAGRRGGQRLGGRLGLDPRPVPGREERADAGRLRGDRARHLPRRRLGAGDRSHLVHRAGLVVPGRDQRHATSWAATTTAPTPTRTPSTPTSRCTRSPASTPSSSPTSRRPTPTCCAPTTSSTRSTRGTATPGPDTWASRRSPTSPRR